MSKEENAKLLMASIKSVDTEEKIDWVLFRPLGLRVALFAKKHSISPNTITFISIFFGILAGHLFYYPNIYINILGIISLMIGSTLDSADGQLARMTNQCSQFGRVLDGVGGYLWFVSIYLHLILRFYPESNNILFIILPAISILSHSFQAMMADYYRNSHLYYVFEKGELEDFELLRRNYDDKKSTMSIFSKIFAGLYLNYSKFQCYITKNFQAFRQLTIIKFDDKLSAELKAKYRAFSKPLQKYCNGLTLNTRFYAIYLTLFFNCFYIYLAYEIIVLNIMVIYLISKHESSIKKINLEIQNI